MSQHATAVVVDTGELRGAAASLRHTARQVIDLAGTLPREAWGAPDWLAGWAADELGSIRLGLDELIGDLETEARALEARADEVDTAEQRWWEIADGELRCGCVLPDGSLVTLPTAATATSSTSGPGVAEALGLGTVVGGTGAGSSFGSIGLGTISGSYPVLTIVGGSGPSFHVENAVGVIGGSWSPDLSFPTGMSATIGGSSWGAGYAPADATDLDAILKLQAQSGPRGPVVGSGGSHAALINLATMQTLNQTEMTNIYNNMHNNNQIQSPLYLGSSYFTSTSDYERYNDLR